MRGNSSLLTRYPDATQGSVRIFSLICDLFAVDYLGVQEELSLGRFSLPADNGGL
jgi:hypothetical protein